VPLSSVLESALKQQPPLDASQGHSVLLFLTASDLLPPPPASPGGRLSGRGRGPVGGAAAPSDEETFAHLLRGLRGQNITIIFVRIHGEHVWSHLEGCLRHGNGPRKPRLAI
jgi:hypothetical protein